MTPTPGPVAVTAAVAASLLGGFFFASPAHRQAVKADLEKVASELKKLEPFVEKGVSELEDLSHRVTTKVVGDSVHVVTSLSNDTKSLINGMFDKGERLGKTLKSSISGFKKFVMCTFTSLDVNGDGKVHVSELRKKLDVNRDGIITVKEWMSDSCEYTIAVDKSMFESEEEDSFISDSLKWWVPLIIGELSITMGMWVYIHSRRKKIVATGSLCVSNIQVIQPDRALFGQAGEIGDDASGTQVAVKVGRHHSETDKSPQVEDRIYTWKHEPFVFEVDYRMPKLTAMTIDVLRDSSKGYRHEKHGHVTIDTLEFAKRPKQVKKKLLLEDGSGAVVSFDIEFKPDDISDPGPAEEAKSSEGM
mmetsp:Transcript_95749/g.166347  ORF Transcript_95749/g.166347 Transcript_95749/m.166347 type:complete len:361 (+) Transcript_95749:75-1157(+)